MSLPNYKFLKEQLESVEGRERVNKVLLLTKIANDLGISMAQLSLAWCLKNKNVSTVILGATSVKQLKENLYSSKIQKQLNKTVMDKIEKILNNKPKPEPNFL